MNELAKENETLKKKIECQTRYCEQKEDEANSLTKEL